MNVTNGQYYKTKSHDLYKRVLEGLQKKINYEKQADPTVFYQTKKK